MISARAGSGGVRRGLLVPVSAGWPFFLGGGQGAGGFRIHLWSPPAGVAGDIVAIPGPVLGRTKICSRPLDGRFNDHLLYRLKRSVRGFGLSNPL